MADTMAAARCILLFRRHHDGQVVTEVSRAISISNLTSVSYSASSNQTHRYLIAAKGPRPSFSATPTPQGPLQEGAQEGAAPEQ